jgi:hypothetical protein
MGLWETQTFKDMSAPARVCDQLAVPLGGKECQEHVKKLVLPISALRVLNKLHG